MQKLMMIAALTLMLPVAAIAQGTEDEREVRSFLAAFDKAVSSRDIPFLEHVLSDDYVYSSASGRMSNRAQVLQFYRRQRDTPTYRVRAIKHENVRVRVVGTMALVTNDFTTQTTPIDAPDAEPETNKGRHTGVLEKRDGRWMAIADQDSDQPHDDKLMEQQIVGTRRKHIELTRRLHNGRSYAELEKSGDIAALQHLLAEGYTSTSRNGRVSSKAESAAAFKTSRITLASADLSDQKVRAIDNGTAVETGTIRYVGTDDGTPFDRTERYTTTWVLWDGWQIVATHCSSVGQKD